MQLVTRHLVGTVIGTFVGTVVNVGTVVVVGGVVVGAACPSPSLRYCNEDGDCARLEACLEGRCAVPDGEGEGAEGAEGEGAEGEGAEGEGAEGEGAEGEGAEGEGAEGEGGEGEGEGEGGVCDVQTQPPAPCALPFVDGVGGCRVPLPGGDCEDASQWSGLDVTVADGVCRVGGNLFTEIHHVGGDAPAAPAGGGLALVFDYQPGGCTVLELDVTGAGVATLSIFDGETLASPQTFRACAAPDGRTTAPSIFMFAECNGGTVDFDNFAFVVAPTACPAAGAVANGSFLGTLDGWTTTGNVGLTPDGPCGASGDEALALSTPAGCSVASATTNMFPPAASDGRGIALRYARRGDASPLVVGDFGTDLAEPEGERRACVNDFFWNQLSPLALQTFADAGGGCAGPGADIVVDNLVFVDDVRCAGDFFDGGFEDGGPDGALISPWQLSGPRGSFSIVAGFGPDAAFEGTHYLHMEPLFPCEASASSAFVDGEGAGHAFTFVYRTNSSGLFVQATSQQLLPLPATETSTWTEARTCAGPDDPRQRLQFLAADDQGVCGSAAFAAGTFYDVDDVQFVVDPICP